MKIFWYDRFRQIPEELLQQRCDVMDPGLHGQRDLAAPVKVILELVKMAAALVTTVVSA